MSKKMYWQLARQKEQTMFLPNLIRIQVSKKFVDIFFFFRHFIFNEKQFRTLCDSPIEECVIKLFEEKLQLIKMKLCLRINSYNYLHALFY